jgi:hypothetical protein
MLPPYCVLFTVMGPVRPFKTVWIRLALSMALMSGFLANGG